MKTSKKPSKARSHAKKSRIAVWLSTSATLLLTAAEAFHDQLPLFATFLSGWKLVAASAVTVFVCRALQRHYAKRALAEDEAQ